MPQDAAHSPREGELAETTRPLAFTIGAAAATLAIVLGAIAGPTVVNCFGSEDGLGSCVYQSIADTWFSAGDDAVSVADSEPTAPADEAAPPAIREPEGEADEPGEPASEPDAGAMIAATFGLLRAEPDGFAVITGSGTPGSEVEILVDGEPFGRAEVDATGDWVFVPETPLPAGGVEITLAEIGAEGLGPESFVVLIDPERTAQPMVVASRPGEASDILQGLVRQPDLVVADAPPPESAEDEQVSGEDEQPAPAESADVNAAEEAAAEPAGTEPPEAEIVAADEPAVADAPVVEEGAGEDVVAAARPEAEPVTESEPEPETERIETALLPDAAAVAPEPAFVIGATPPSIDAIEIDGDRNFFAGGGPEGVIVRLYVDDVFVADSIVEGGRWLVEAGNVLTATMHTVRIDMLAPGSATVAARAGVNFVVDLPAGTREDDLVIAGLPESVEAPAAEAESAAPEPAVPAEDAAQADEVADVSESVVADAPAETPRSDEGEVAAEDAPEGTLDVTEAGIAVAPEAETPGAEAVGEAIEPMPGEDDAAAVETAAEPVAAEAVGDDAPSVAAADEPAAEVPDEPALEPETPVEMAPAADEAADAGAPVADAVIAPAVDPVPGVEGDAPEAGALADEAPADEAVADADQPAETPAEAEMLPEIETSVEVLAEVDQPAAELETAAEPVAESEPVEDEPVADEAAIDAAPAAEAVPGESMSDAAPAVEEPVVDAAPVPEEPAVDAAPVMEAAPAEPMTDTAPVAEESAVDAVPAAQAVPEGAVVDAAPATDEPAVDAALVAEDAPGEPETTPAAEPVPAATEPEAPADEAVSGPALEEPAIGAAEEPAAPDAAVTEPVVEEPAVPGLDPSLPTLVASPVGDPEAQRFASGRAIIRRGDNLWTIARRVYGAGIRYTTIYEANTEQIRDPNRIYPGQVFDLPQAESQE